MSADQELDSLLDEIRILSEKNHETIPPAINQTQKKAAIVQAGLEKLIIELVMEKMEIKLLIMSLFYLWFTLDAPLRGINPKLLEDYSPFEEMGNIIHLIKSTAQSLPEPTLTSDLELLNAKMQSLKSVLPDPASLDEVPEDIVPYQSKKINTAIHTLTSDYIRKGTRPEIIANALFSQWLRLSVFYGISEKDWQKMDYYLVEILSAVRNYLPTLFKN